MKPINGSCGCGERERFLLGEGYNVDGTDSIGFIGSGGGDFVRSACFG
jgi:hypothetical protein